MIKDGIIVNTLLKLIEKSIDINNKLYKRAIEKRYNKKKIGYSEFYKGGNVFRKNYRNYLLQKKQYINLNLYKLILIEFDTFEKKRLKNNKRQTKKKINIIYYIYSKPDYIARNYRSKNKISR